jgi:predicted esterase
MKRILILIIFLTLLIGFIIIYNRDNIFYFKPKKTYIKTFDDFLKRYRAKKYLSTVENVDIIDIPPRKKTKKVIVYFHGNYGNITMREDILSFLSDNFNTRVVSVDYLGVRVVSIDSVVKVSRSVINKLIEEGVDNDDIILWGESIGCAMSLETISVCGVNNFVMLAGFRRMKDMVGVKIDNFFGEFLKLFVDELDNERHIKNAKDIKMIVLHSKGDELIPYYQVKEMVDKLGLEHYEIKGSHSKPEINKDIIEIIKERFSIFAESMAIVDIFDIKWA